MNHDATTLVGDLTDSSLFTGDVRQMAGSVIERYGPEEWRAVVLTTELHGHLGVYSLIGAKMGVRALELLSVPAGDVRVASAAGHEPPLSCLNDGLQVATGATLGQGTITIISGETAPAAVFTSGSRHLRLELRGTIAEQIGGTLRQLVQRCGGLTPEYWAQVRQLAIQYWRDLDRREAFDESWE
jgi:pyrimidine-specific ribonucleoside hydrolase